MLQRTWYCKGRLRLVFKENDMFNDDEIAKYFLDKYNEKIDVSKALKWFARLRLGEQIKNCVEEKGYCYFRAEL